MSINEAIRSHLRTLAEDGARGLSKRGADALGFSQVCQCGHENGLHNGWPSACTNCAVLGCKCKEFQAADAISHPAADLAGAAARDGSAAPATDTDPVRKAITSAIIQLIRLPVPRIRGLADAADFDGRAHLLQQLAKILDPIFYEIGKEASADTFEVFAEDFEDLIAKTLHDHALIGQFEAAAEEWREENGQFGVGA